ncbi:MAG TPA: apolipoprotein N-acyltransferase [Paracoccaceae bacterium]|nr:apolipoprotein N-acyltransferase [Paracoccaceae bacterium]
MADSVTARGRSAGLGRWQRLGLALSAGVLLTAGHPPVQFPWTFFVAMPAIVWLVASARDARAAAWVGWGAGFGHFVTVFHWMGYPFLVDAEQFAWLMPLPVLILPAFLALFWAAAAWAARRFWPGGMISGALLVAALLTAAEIARSFAFTGYPWALPGYVWLDLPPMQAAAWVGPFGMTLLTLVLTSVPLLALAGRRWVALVLSLAACTVVWMAGASRLDQPTAYAPDAPVLRIVQPNAPQHLKFVPGYREEFYRRTLAATAAPPDPELGRPDLVLWPETAIHFLIDESPAEAERIARAANGATVILGAMRREVAEPRNRWFNSLVTIRPDGTLGPGYDKHHLVPFGEYMPFWSVLRHLGLPQFTAGPGYTAGPGPRTLSLPGMPSFSALICYEAIFPWEVIAEGPRPDWMLQLTNDAWFGPWAGPRQHYAQARIRAIEQGLPLVRAANTGISAVVDSHGREITSLPLGVYGKIDAKLPAALPVTLYGRTGYWPALAVVVLLAMAMVSRHARVGTD